MENQILLRNVMLRTDDRTAFTLIELLVVIAIISLLLSILLPALYTARNEGMAGKCLSNIRSITAATAMYMDNQEDRKLLPWYQWPAYGGNCNNPHGPYFITLFTPWVFGGFMAPSPNPRLDNYNVDATEYPAQIRPLNAFVDRQAVEDDVIDLYICPGDRSSTTAIIGENWNGDFEEMRASWEANGNSYSFNTRWAQGYSPPYGDFNMLAFGCGNNTPYYAERIGRHMIGGEAAELIMWVEQGFYGATYRAGPTVAGIATGSQPLRFGWHRKWSAWVVAMADGHAKYGFFDTRQIYGLGGTIWQPNIDLNEWPE